MESISKLEELSAVSQNSVYINADKVQLINNSITFTGENNILVIEDDAIIKNSKIKFMGSNAVCYLSKNRHVYYLDLTIHNRTAVFIDKNCYFNGTFNVTASEMQNVIVGLEGLFSFGISLRTADPHLIYDVHTKRRLNSSRSILLGDHIWIGQSAFVLKGSKIGSGSIIGAAAVVAGKTIPSNVSAVGNPARVVKEGVFFTKDCVHSWEKEQTAKYEVSDTDEWIYERDAHTVDLSKIDEEIKSKETVADKLEVIKKRLVQSKHKNRFFIEAPRQKKKSIFSKNS